MHGCSESRSEKNGSELSDRKRKDGDVVSEKGSRKVKAQ